MSPATFCPDDEFGAGLYGVNGQIISSNDGKWECTVGDTWPGCMAKPSTYELSGGCNTVTWSASPQAGATYRLDLSPSDLTKRSVTEVLDGSARSFAFPSLLGKYHVKLTVVTAAGDDLVSTYLQPDPVVFCGDTATNPQDSCTDYYECGCTTGTYPVKATAQTVPQDVQCVMYRGTNTDGGYEVVWKSLGGYNLPNTPISNQVLWQPSSYSSTTVVMPQKGVTSSQTSEMSGRMAYWRQKSDSDWKKVGHLYKDGIQQEENEFRLLLGATTIDDVMGGLGTGPCVQMPSKMSLWTNGIFAGETDYLKVNSKSIGLANNGHGASDDCGQSSSNMITGNHFKGRIDGGTGLNAVRHLFSYVHDSAGRDTSRCMYACWSGSHTKYYETHYWLAREDKAVGTFSNPASSCEAILEHGMPTGTYWVSHNNVKYQVVCENSIQKGGWEVVWKNFGGFGYPNTPRSNKAMFDDPPSWVSPLTTPTTTYKDAATHTSELSKTWEYYYTAKNLEWIKVVTFFYPDGTSVTQDVHVLMGNVTMWDVFDAAPSTACHQVDNKIKVYVNSQYAGETDYVNSYQRNGRTYGLANSGHSAADDCGQPYSNTVHGEFFQRWDTSTNTMFTDGTHALNTIRHLFSYVHTDAGKSTSRCAYVCWPGSGMDGYYETFWWGVREGVDAYAYLGTDSMAAASCQELKEHDFVTGFYYVQGPTGPYEVFCDMDYLDGGFEVLWKNLGGVALPNSYTPISNAALMSTTGNWVNGVTPPLEYDDTTHVSQMSSAWSSWYTRNTTEWVKVATLYKPDGTTVTQTIRLVMGDATMEEVFTVPAGTTCHAVSAPIKVYINGNYAGQTSYVRADAAAGWYGLANAGAGADCGQPTTNLITGTYFTDRLDSASALSTIDHLFSYKHTEGGRDTSSCMYSCWDNTRDAGYYETFFWMARPAI